MADLPPDVAKRFVLLSYGAEAAKGGQDTVKLLNESQGIAGSSLINEPIRISRRQECMLHIASSRGHSMIVDWLLQNNADPNVQDVMGMTSLHLCCEQSTFNQEIVGKLLDAKASVDLRSRFGESALEMAMRVKNADLEKVFKTAQAQQGGDKKDDTGKRDPNKIDAALRSVAKAEKRIIQSFKLLQDNEKRDFAEDLLCKYLGKCKKLVRAGVFSIHSSSSGASYVLSASMVCADKPLVCLKVVRSLLELKANPNTVGINGKAPLHHACQQFQKGNKHAPQTIANLLEFKADIGLEEFRSGKSPLRYVDEEKQKWILNAVSGQLTPFQFAEEKKAEASGSDTKTDDAKAKAAPVPQGDADKGDVAAAAPEANKDSDIKKEDESVEKEPRSVRFAEIPAASKERFGSSRRDEQQQQEDDEPPKIGKLSGVTIAQTSAEELRHQRLLNQERKGNDGAADSKEGGGAEAENERTSQKIREILSQVIIGTEEETEERQLNRIRKQERQQQILGQQLNYFVETSPTGNVRLPLELKEGSEDEKAAAAAAAAAAISVEDMQEYFLIIRGSHVTRKDVEQAMLFVQKDSFNAEHPSISKNEFLPVLQALEVISSRKKTIHWESRLLDSSGSGWLSKASAGTLWDKHARKQSLRVDFSTFMDKRKDVDDKLGSFVNPLRSMNVHRNEILSLVYSKPDASRHY
eukprot:jgi/Bigna1/72160/fgenesh1_pg.18_\